MRSARAPPCCLRAPLAPARAPCSLTSFLCALLPLYSCFSSRLSSSVCACRVRQRAVRGACLLFLRAVVVRVCICTWCVGSCSPLLPRFGYLLFLLDGLSRADEVPCGLGVRPGRASAWYGPLVYVPPSHAAWCSLPPVLAFRSPPACSICSHQITGFRAMALSSASGNMPPFVSSNPCMMTSLWLSCTLSCAAVYAECLALLASAA